MGIKLRELERGDVKRTFLFACPGYNCAHPFEVPTWKWNESLTEPTFQPSLLCNSNDPATRCHLFLTEGKLIFQTDCHHSLAGKTVECPDWTEDSY